MRITPEQQITLHAAKASKFVTLDESVREALLRSNVVPVNDIFFDLWRSQHKIELLYGSYGSGKSVFIVEKLIRLCLELPYFRCYFGRKVLDTVRGTVHKTIVDLIKELKKEHLFHFSEKPNGSMIIICKLNGNEFIPFGANDSASLKSIKDPTHFFCEELDQFSFTDFGFIYSRLRTQKAFTQFFGAFNTEKIYQSHWIRKVLLEGAYKDQVLARKANYDDNYFIDREDYLNKLKLIANGSVAVLNSIAKGEWGMARTGFEFWKQFDDTRHVQRVDFDYESAIHISLDENVNPYVTCTLWQIDQQAKLIKQIHEILSKSPRNNAPKAARDLIEYLREINYRDVIFVYGDPSADRRSTVDENSSSFYDKYIGVLENAGFVVSKRVQRSAPQVALSGAFINEIYESSLYGWNIVISEQCFTSIEDYMLVKEDAEGKMLKEKEKDKETKITAEPRGHISDTKRYFITTILADEFESYRDRRTNNLSELASMFR